jgi:hypothetical protein
MKLTELSGSDAALVERIASRAVRIYKSYGVKTSKLSVMMDIHAAHQIRPLRLEELAEASTADLMHDVAGINRHLDREAMQLTDCFIPRFAKPEEKR